MNRRLVSIALAATLAVISWGGTEVAAISTPLTANPAAFAKAGDHDPATCGVASKSFTYTAARACWPSAKDSAGSNGPGRYIVRHPDGHISLTSVSLVATDRAGKVIISSNRDAYAAYNSYFGWSGQVDNWDLTMHFGLKVQGHGYFGNWVSTDYVTPWCAGINGSCNIWWWHTLYNGQTTAAGANMQISTWGTYAPFYCRTYDSRWNQFSGWCGS